MSVWGVHVPLTICRRHVSIVPTTPVAVVPDLL
jgi:hypothetical protein